ncbi:hypothetical protein FRB90_005528 [Tulasnella sp. 427]|nr:hypothetical protein FRB90_005528 [Tulasnella sp. 427]
MKYGRRVGQSPGPQLANIPCSISRQDITKPTLTGWRWHTTPEGDSYWSDDQRKIITHIDPARSAIANSIRSAYEMVCNKIGDWEHLEVFFNLSRETPETPFGAALEYYLVNHATREIFWIEDVKTEKVGIGDVRSLEELKSALLPEYWIHIDYFPCHRAVGNEETEELSNALRHGAVDDMTAPGSTFPYSSHECREYLILIKGFQSSSASPIPLERAYETASIARIWSSIGPYSSRS